MQKVLFCFSRSTGSIKILVSIKNLGHYKKLPWDKFVKKKRTFCKTFRSMQIFSRIAMFSWLFIWFFRIINACQFFFTLNILFDVVDSCWDSKKKNFFVGYHLHPHFLKNYYGWTKLRTCSYTYREEVLYRKKWL